MKKILKLCIALLIVVIGGLFLFMVQILKTDDFNFNTPFRGKLVNTQTVDLKDIQSLNIQYSSDRIEILKSPSDEFILKEYMSIDKANYYASIHTSDRNIQITGGNRSFHLFFQSKIEIYLPASYYEELEVSSSSGSIYIDTPLKFSSLKLQNKSGSIKTDCAIYASDLQIKNSSGAIKLDTVESKTTLLNNSSGSIKIDRLSGKIDAENSSGTTKINGGAFGGSFRSTSGAMKLHPDQITSDLSIKNSSGSCKLYLQNQPSFYFTANSSSGSIDTYFDHELQIRKNHQAKGKIGSSPAFHLNVQTSSGSIKIAAASGNDT